MNVADVVIMNILAHDSGYEYGTTRALLKSLLQARLRLASATAACSLPRSVAANHASGACVQAKLSQTTRARMRTVLVVAIRDRGNTPLELFSKVCSCCTGVFAVSRGGCERL
jgi:hypothetical protein